ncbi:MAG: type 4a pilus biogenesis protein PilO [Candidatus Acidiferrales bacterium]
MRNFAVWKNRIRIAVVALFALNAALLLFDWQVIGATPGNEKAQLERLRKQHDLWSSDIQRASEIRTRLGEVEKDCDRFFEEQFLSEEVGSSALLADLSKIAADAGLQARNITYKPKELDKRNVIEVDINAAVEGNYEDLVAFINGLEKSERFYLMEGLSLTSAQSGELKLNLQLKTYFRLRRA